MKRLSVPSRSCKAYFHVLGREVQYAKETQKRLKKVESLVMALPFAVGKGLDRNLQGTPDAHAI